MPNQITPELLDLMTDIIGGMAGTSARTIATMSPNSEQQPPQGQPQVQAPTPSPYQKYFIKKRGRKPATFHAAPRPEGPSAPKIKPPKAPKAVPLSIGESSQRRTPASYSQPPQQVQAPKLQPPQDQRNILETVKRGAQEYGKPNQGTNLAHWLRTHYTNRSVTSQFEAAGVDSLDRLTQILNNNQRPQYAVNLDLFHDDYSPFALISEPGQGFQSGGAAAVVVGPPYVNQVHQLENAFPGIHFMAVEEAPKELEEAANILAKPLAVKSLTVRPSPYFYRMKAQETPEKPSRSESEKPKEPKLNQSRKPVQQQEQAPEDLEQVQHEETVLPVQQTQEQKPQNTENIFVQGQEEEKPQLTEDQQFYINENNRRFKEETNTYLEYYLQNVHVKEANYKSELPSEEEVAKGQYIPMPGISSHGSHIGRIVVGGTSSFYKGGLYTGGADSEVECSNIAQLLDVPAPIVRKTAARDTQYGAVLMSLVDGTDLDDIVNGLEAKVPERYVYPFLQKILKTGDIDRQILFSYLLCIEDRQKVQYMISGDRLVSGDHEARRPGGLNLPENNDLFTIKYAAVVGIGGDYLRTPLNRTIAGEFASQMGNIMKMLEKNSDEYIQAVERRGKVLGEFSQAKSNLYGTLFDLNWRVGR